MTHVGWMVPKGLLSRTLNGESRKAENGSDEILRTFCRHGVIPCNPGSMIPMLYGA